MFITEDHNQLQGVGGRGGGGEEEGRGLSEKVTSKEGGPI